MTIATTALNPFDVCRNAKEKCFDVIDARTGKLVRSFFIEDGAAGIRALALADELWYTELQQQPTVAEVAALAAHEAIKAIADASAPDSYEAFEAETAAILNSFDVYADARAEREASPSADDLALAHQFVAELSQLEPQMTASYAEGRTELYASLSAYYDALSHKVRAMGFEIGPDGQGGYVLMNASRTQVIWPAPLPAIKMAA